MKFKKKVLPNGLRVVTIPMEEQRTVTVLVLVEAGSKYETKDKNGLSHFLEHMCFKGTLRRPEADAIATELDGLGAEYNAFTGHEYTGYYVKVEAKHLEKALDIIADTYLNPKFDEGEIEREKGVIVDEINMYEDLPMRKASELMMELLYKNQPAGWSIAGTPELVRSFHRDDFIKYRDRHYVAEATTVIVAGKINEAEVFALVKKQFAGIGTGPKGKKVKVKDTQKEPEILLRKKETDQTHLVVGVRTYDLFHAQFPVLGVLSAVLGAGMSSRLFRKIRGEMGVGYYVRAGNDSLTDHGFLAVSAGVDNARVKEVVTAILAEFSRLKTELVPPVELKKVKDYLSGRLYLGLESSDELAEFYGFQEILREEMKKPEEMVRRMNAVTPEEIRTLAKKIFVPARLNLVAIGPDDHEEEYRKLLSL